MYHCSNNERRKIEIEDVMVKVNQRRFFPLQGIEISIIKNKHHRK